MHTANLRNRRFASTLRALVVGLALAGIGGTSAALADTDAVKCVQKQLNGLGFNAGLADGLMGVRTFLAGETYIRFMRANAEKGWAQPSLNDANARHWCEKIAEAHPKVAPFWRAITKTKPVPADPKAIYQLAHKLDTGQGVRRNEVLAFKWYRRAAELGHAAAQRELGSMYDAGRGVAENDVEAKRWYFAAAFQGDAQAQFMLGKYHSSHEKGALSWLWQAANQGHAEAITELEKRFGI